LPTAVRTPLVFRRSAILLLAMTLVVGACDSSDVEDGPTERLVTGGSFHLELLPAFREKLAGSRLQMVWTPPPCSWRLRQPFCEGDPTTDAASLDVPVVGGRIAVRDEREVFGRLELAGRVAVVGAGGSVTLDDFTFNPLTSILTAGILDQTVDVLFFDGTLRKIKVTADQVTIERIEVKVMEGLADQLRSRLGSSPIEEFDKVGDVILTVDVDR
jgi:hypothetical protein